MVRTKSRKGIQPSVAARNRVHWHSVEPDRPTGQGSIKIRLEGSVCHFIDCDGSEAHGDFMRLFETNAFRFAELHEWLEAHVSPLP